MSHPALSAADQRPVEHGKDYEESGRYYHAWRKGKYMLPSDDEEGERLDLLHKFFLRARGGRLHTSQLWPEQAPHRILDVGTGTGIWAIDMAQAYPSAHVRGVDLILMQPDAIMRNNQFLQMDVEAPWQGMEPNSWDLIFVRTLRGSISSWPHFYAEIFAHLKPYYGCLEQIEVDWTPRCIDDSFEHVPHIQGWMEEVFGAMDDHGRSMRVNPSETRAQLHNAGFIDIKEDVIKVPISGWTPDSPDAEVARWFNLGLITGLEAMSLAPMTRMRGRSVEQVRQAADKVRNDLCTRGIRLYCIMFVWTARRPS